jgi:hypothetical protein
MATVRAGRNAKLNVHRMVPHLSAVMGMDTMGMDTKSMTSGGASRAYRDIRIAVHRHAECRVGAERCCGTEVANPLKLLLCFSFKLLL